jgi:predicted RNA-binding Zn-ribbon protein involved in translation (DUF1610 family)
MVGKYKCPGFFGSGTPVIKIKRCPGCGGEVELFSIDMKIACPSCGQPVFNNINSCAEYCRYAEQCLGTEMYGKLKK